MTSDVLEGLNSKQREAVETIDGPLLIVAGPGSGKTRVITHRIAYLVRTCGVRPYRIVAVTFTNKAAREMRARLFGYTDEDSAAPLLGSAMRDQGLIVSTFHSFCAMLLRREGAAIGLDRNFAIYDSADQSDLIKRSMAEVEVDAKRFGPGALLSSISTAKSQLLGVEGFGMRRETYFDEVVLRVYERYQQLLEQSSAVDFDDLLFKTYLLLQQMPEVARKYQERYVHFMIDEFQDTNVAQYAIAKQLSHEHGNLCVVGDPDQSIYSWRNADIRNILSFQTDFPESKLIALEENYRSSQTILGAAHGLISANIQRVEKELFTQNERGVPIVVAEAYNEEEEAQTVIKEIQGLAESGHALGDIAVMYRVNAQSRALEQSCLRYGVPYQVVGGLKFYHRQEVKDLAAYLRLVANPDDDVSLARVVNVPARGIGRRTMDEVTRLARDEGIPMSSAIQRITKTGPHVDESTGEIETIEHSLQPRSVRALAGFMGLIQGLAEEARTTGLLDLIDLVLERSGYKRHLLDEADRGEERWENIQEFRGTARDFLHLGFDDALTAFLESVSLVSDVDSFEERTELVTLITLHQAKGLEFPVVFIVGMEEGLLPHIRSMDSPSEVEEERRLCYVGMTRAKERLYLLRAFRRGFWGGPEPRDASRFLADIPRDMIVSPRRGSAGRSRDVGWSPKPANAAAKETDGPRPPKTGDKVRHAIFGEGIVVSTKPSGEDFEVTVAFQDGQGVKRLLLSFAPLETVT